MKIFTFLLCFVLVGLSVSAADVDVYILAGQSNMDGRGDAAELDGPLAKKQAGTLIAYASPADPNRNKDELIRTGWQTLSPGFSIPPNKRKKPLPGKAFGPELSFALAMKRASPHGSRIAIIKVARGGTSLKSNWSPTGYMYQGLIAEIGVSMKALADDGYAATVRGVLWHQGESDGRNLKTYQGELETLITNLRAKLDSPALPFVIGELAPTKPQAFRELQRKIAEDNEGVLFVSSADLTTSDKTHFDAASQVILGQRFAEALLANSNKQSSVDMPDGAARLSVTHHKFLSD